MTRRLRACCLPKGKRRRSHESTAAGPSQDPVCGSLSRMEAAFFALEKTVIAKASMVAFGRDFYREGLISRRTIATAIWGHFVYQHLGASESKLEEVREKALSMTK